MQSNRKRQKETGRDRERESERVWENWQHAA